MSDKSRDWLSIAFTAWAGVVGFAAYLIMAEITDVREAVSEGILPVAQARVTMLETRMARLENFCMRIYYPDEAE